MCIRDRSDGVIFASDIKKNYIEMIKKAKIPVLECFSNIDFEKEYLDFYEKFLPNEN